MIRIDSKGTNDAEEIIEEMERDLELQEDGELVQRAQAGDREAFGELIRRHRRQIYGYARRLTQEPFLAEDIVQDALVRAFLHLGTLVDVARFLPWLHRIVRNQAYTRLRSNPLMKEKPLSSLQRSEEEGGSDGADWSNLDHILQRLSASYTKQASDAANPEEHVMRRQLLDMISSMLSCLNRRERQIFESHFFDHLSPQEIAKLFSLSSSNVYQIISRSRKKVANQRVRVIIDHYIADRKDWGVMMTKQLPKSTDNHDNACGTWTSAAWALYRMLGYTEQKLSLAQVMGYTGHAFRITICQEDVHIAGPTMFPFRELLTRGLNNLGWSARIVETQDKREVIGENTNLLDPSVLTSAAKEKRPMQEDLPAALDLIHYAVDKGTPVLTWDLSIPEFGIIYGYDDERRTLYTMEVMKDGELPYDHLGRGTLEELFVLALDERKELDPRAMLRGALEMALQHYRGEEAPLDRAERGLRAYDAWIGAFRGGKIEPNGNAYNAAVVHDARYYAAEFLSGISAEWQGSGEEDTQLRKLSAEAAKAYRQIAEQLHELAKLFPFPAGDDPNLRENGERAVQVLRTVKTLEERAVSLLEQMYAALA
ncbi:RNA polymerase sigma factor [Paenibacillus nanensis]|nr:RNA polymerase sigma factor [Paenibacillus nanensis]